MVGLPNFEIGQGGKVSVPKCWHRCADGLMMLVSVLWAGNLTSQWALPAALCVGSFTDPVLARMGTQIFDIQAWCLSLCHLAGSWCFACSRPKGNFGAVGWRCLPGCCRLVTLMWFYAPFPSHFPSLLGPQLYCYLLASIGASRGPGTVTWASLSWWAGLRPWEANTLDFPLTGLCSQTRCQRWEAKTVPSGLKPCVFSG